MTEEIAVLDILVVDDDKENIIQLKQLLPGQVGVHPVAWDYLDDFEQALNLLKRRRYDLLVSDIYRNRDGQQKTIVQGDIKARELVDQIRSHRFCPIVLFTDGQKPTDLVARPFVWSTDKGASNFLDQLMSCLEEAIGTGLPHIARRMHDELDRFTGSYVWHFLAERWDDLRERYKLNTTALDRIIRQRAAIQLGRFDGIPGDMVERDSVDPIDFYIYPPIGNAMRLGEIIRRKGTSEIRLALTPHCFLITQPGQTEPRATHMLTVKTVAATDLSAEWKWAKKAAAIQDELRRRTAFPASNVPPPEGRYCFLPGFLDIPDLYCDLLQLESLTFQAVVSDFERLAVLDAPYAEALQAAMGRLYGAVGVPVLNSINVQHLGPGTTRR